MQGSQHPDIPGPTTTSRTPTGASRRAPSRIGTVRSSEPTPDKDGHIFAGGGFLFLSPEEAEYAEANGRVTVELATADIVEVTCLGCRRKRVDVLGKPCIAASKRPRDTAHLRGGKENGRRAARLKERRGHREHDCDVEGCWPTSGSQVADDYLDDAVHPADR